MRTILVLVALSLLASRAALAQEEPQQGAIEYTLVAELSEGSYVWVNEDGDENPRLRVAPNRDATIHIEQGNSSDGVPHDIQVGGGETSEQIVQAGDSASVTFTAPPSGTIPYLCTIHPTTMAGEIEVTEDAVQESGENGDGGDGVPGPALALVLALVGLAAVARGRGR